MALLTLGRFAAMPGGKSAGADTVRRSGTGGELR